MRVFSLIFVLAVLTAVTYSQTAVVIGENAYLRGSPIETGAVVDTLLPGTAVAIFRRQGRWFLVQASPFVGWIHGKSLRLTRAAKPKLPSQMPSAETVSSQPASGTELPAPTEAETKTETSPEAAPPGAPSKTAEPSASDKRIYIRGPRGGCYYIKPNGRKVYGDHNLCN